MPNEKKITPFSDDSPKTNPWEQDRLGYRPFASRIASAILSLDAPNGYVVGLHGAWGSGKSTALAFVQAFVKKHNDELPTGAQPLLMVDFRPWMISGHQDLVSAFFKVLAETLPTKRKKGLKRCWQRLLRLARIGGDPVLDAAATVAMAAHPVGAPAFKAGAYVAKKSIGSAIDRWLEEPSLQKAYDALRTELQDKGVRILVLIDDIDRLDKSEIRSTMQMVKTVGRLPNVVYLLAYDREIVWSALDEMPSADTGRPGFAEKIIQHELELPQPSRAALLSLLDSEVDFLPTQDTASTRRYHLVTSGIRRWIRLPRDVSRLSNAVKFAWPALEGEIDPMDLLCMEGLRLFDQRAFAWVRDYRALLLNKDGYRMLHREQREAVGEALRSSLPAKTRADQVEVLCALFPNQATIIRGEQRYGDEAWSESVKRRGMATEAGYDAYFSLFPPIDSVPKSAVDAAMRSLDDESVQTATLRRFLESRDHAPRLTAQYFEEIQFRFMGSHAVRPTRALLHALFSVGEEVQRIDAERDFGSLTPQEHLSFLIADVLRAMGQEEAGTALIEAFARSTSPSFCAEVLVRRARELGILPRDGVEPANLIDRETFDALGTRVGALIEAAEADGTLERAPRYYCLATCWAHVAGHEAPRAWLNRGMGADASFLAKVASGLLAYSIGSTGRSYSLSDQPTEAFYDRDAIVAACARHRDATGLSADESGRINALRIGLAAVTSRNFSAAPQITEPEGAGEIQVAQPHDR